MSSLQSRAPWLRLILLACSLPAFALLVGWTSANTVVTRVWPSPYIGTHPMGKTLVLAYTLIPRPLLSGRVEQEWVVQLQRLGVDAHSWGTLALGGSIPSMKEVAHLLANNGFDTLLVTQVIALKPINRNIPISPMAVVETRLYLAPIEKVYWSVESDTFLFGYSGQELLHPRERDLREYVEVIIRTMSGGGIL